jgi:uncharacterized protein
MDQEIQALLRKASRKLQAARSALSQGFPEEAASDAYYAMYHAAKALLLPRAPRVKRHGDVRIKFRAVLVDTGKIDKRFDDYLDEGLKARHFADYGTDLEVTISLDEAKEALVRAEEFIAMAQDSFRRAEGEQGS